MNEPLRRLYTDRFGTSPTFALLAGDASNRRFYRLSAPDGPAVVGVVGPEADENRAFLSFSQTFHDLGLPVPQIHAADVTAGVWLEEDLGDTTLYQALTEARAAAEGAFPEAILPVYRRVLEILPRFQVEGGRAVDYDVAYPRAAFDRLSIAWDLDYFKYHFLKLAHVPFHEERLERDFETLADHLLATDTSHFLYRDFQSRNVMVREGEPWFIDYQGGRRGALQYDVASLLYDAKAEIPEPVRADLLEHYLDALEAHHPVNRKAFHRHFRAYVLVRILQAMGAYGYRGFYERKRHFLLSVPPAVQNIEHLLATEFLPVDLPELRAVCERICALPSFGAPPPVEGDGLTLHVSSFSFRQGVPESERGHGGGFVFDCRALPNPGRDPVLAGLSGLDRLVAQHLEPSERVAAFFEHARDLVDLQVDTYRARAFCALDVAFGCTGGQHRSVYMAQRLARHVRTRWPDVQVVVTHTEAARWPETASRHEETVSAPPPDRR